MKPKPYLVVATYSGECCENTEDPGHVLVDVVLGSSVQAVERKIRRRYERRGFTVGDSPGVQAFSRATVLSWFKEPSP